METKLCPKCNVIKPIENYHRYWSEARQKYRIGNYCKPCAKTDANARAKESYRKNIEAKKQYAKDYRANPENKAKRKALQDKFKPLYRKNLQDCYVRDQMKQKFGFATEDLRANPEIVETYKNQLLIKRKIKEHGKK